MWRRYGMLPVVVAGLAMVSGMAAGQVPTVTSPAVSPASKVPTQLPETDCSAMTQNYLRQAASLLGEMTGITSTIQALNFQIQMLRARLGELQAERNQLANGGMTKAEQVQANQIGQQMEVLTTQIEDLQEQVDDSLKRLRVNQEEIGKLHAEYAARRQALRCA